MKAEEGSKEEVTDTLIHESVSPHRFRIFKRQGDRRAFRLEQAFWEVLESAARQQKKRIGELVFDIVRESKDANNLSSILRCYAIRWQGAQIQSASSPSSRSVVDATMTVFNSVPSPGLILNENRHIVAWNRALLDFMHRKTGCGLQEMHEVRLSFDRPIPQILGMIDSEASGKVECGFRFLLNDTSVSGRVSISQIKVASGELRSLLVFIIP